MTASVRPCLPVALAFVFCGCAQPTPPAPPPGTGSREAVRSFYKALMHQDWPQAYALLDPDSQQACSLGAFRARGEVFYRGLEFTPQELYIRTCDERGGEAISRVVLSGHKEARTLRHNDGLTLRRTDAGWRVVLPANFGAAKS